MGYGNRVYGMSSACGNRVHGICSDLWESGVWDQFWRIGIGCMGSVLVDGNHVYGISSGS